MKALRLRGVMAREADALLSALRRAGGARAAHRRAAARPRLQERARRIGPRRDGRRRQWRRPPRGDRAQWLRRPRPAHEPAVDGPRLGGEHRSSPRPAPTRPSPTGTTGTRPARARRRAHLLRWRPRPGAQRRATTPRARASGAASQLDPSPRSSLLSATGSQTAGIRCCRARWPSGGRCGGRWRSAPAATPSSDRRGPSRRGPPSRASRPCGTSAPRRSPRGRR